MTSPGEKVRYEVTYMGAGSYSNVLRVNASRGSSTWAFALGISRMEPRRELSSQEDNAVKGTINLKLTEDMLHELASGRLVASLRQPGFLPQYRAFVLNGRSFAFHRPDKNPLTAKIYKALKKGDLADATYWRDFKGEDADVLVVCMGLGDKGDLNKPSTLLAAARDQDAVRKWLFTLQWSLLVAERTFNFQHRDIKLGNMVLSNEGRGSSTFQLSLTSADFARLNLSSGGPERRFRVEREEGELSALVPKFIDLGFSNYVATSLPSEDGQVPLAGNRDVPMYDNVNSWFADVATYPSPDMLFLPNITDEERDFDSDLFTFGVAALELMSGSPAFLVNICSSSVLINDFLRLCREAVEKMDDDDDDKQRVNKVIVGSHRILYGYMQLMLALHGELLPPITSPFRTTFLYRVLSSPTVFAFLRNDLASQEKVLKALGDIRRVQSPDAVDYLASCLTWDKSARGVFPDGPRAHPETPGALRLLFHPYFDPLLSTQEEAAKSAATEHYTLRYRDPPTSADAATNTRRFERVAARILSVELGLLRQASDIYECDRFEADMDSFVADILSVNSSMTTTDDMDIESDDVSLPSPPKKKARKGDYGRRRRISLLADEETL